MLCMCVNAVTLYSEKQESYFPMRRRTTKINIFTENCLTCEITNHQLFSIHLTTTFTIDTIYQTHIDLQSNHNKLLAIKKAILVNERKEI